MPLLCKAQNILINKVTGRTHSMWILSRVGILTPVWTPCLAAPTFIVYLTGSWISTCVKTWGCRSSILTALIQQRRVKIVLCNMEITSQLTNCFHNLNFIWSSKQLCDEKTEVQTGYVISLRASGKRRKSKDQDMGLLIKILCSVHSTKLYLLTYHHPPGTGDHCQQHHHVTTHSKSLTTRRTHFSAPHMGADTLVHPSPPLNKPLNHPNSPGEWAWFSSCLHRESVQETWVSMCSWARQTCTNLGSATS